jgi:hypothetical protein
MTREILTFIYRDLVNNNINSPNGPPKMKNRRLYKDWIRLLIDKIIVDITFNKYKNLEGRIDLWQKLQNLR